MLSKSVKATMGAFEERVKNLGQDEKSLEDRLAGLKAHLNRQVEIPLEYIQIEDNVRRHLDTGSARFQELVDSIRTQGLLQNLVVELRQEDGRHRLYCVAGQRRLLAAQQAGKVKANCLIKQFDDKADRIAAGLAENLTREDLHGLDVAEGYAGLIENGWTEEKIAQHFERNPRTIRRYLTIAAWPKEILQLIREHQEVFTTKVLFNELVARRFADQDQFRKAVQAKIEKPAAAKRTETETRIRELEQELKSRLDLKVSVSGNEEAGKIVLTYSDPDQLGRIRELLLK
ncbi:MAG TPA: ParB/RepB/Spo0J family partition protein [Blastocatellia bacterium]|nr:ParB/RepB/Spo0J family partition protein [Blastocatellia bacterium]